MCNNTEVEWMILEGDRMTKGQKNEMRIKIEAMMETIANIVYV